MFGCCCWMFLWCFGLIWILWLFVSVVLILLSLFGCGFRRFMMLIGLVLVLRLSMWVSLLMWCCAMFVGLCGCGSELVGCR